MKKILAAVCLVLVAGCAEARRGDVPAAISGEEQIGQLDARAELVKSLWGRGRVSMEWKDEKGNHRETADALLMMRRIEGGGGGGGGPEADVVLVGRFSGNEMFEMGVNATQHWMAFFVEPKRAYVGRVNAPVVRLRADEAGNGNAGSGRSVKGGGVAPFQADRVMEVLGLAKLPADLTRMKVLEEANEVEVFKRDGYGGTYRERVEVIDRRTGDVTAVRFYLPDGRLEGSATLGDYHVFKGDYDGVPNGMVRLPYLTRVEYPERGGQVEVVLKTLKVNGELRGDFAEMPDFAGLGLQVVEE